MEILYGIAMLIVFLLGLGLGLLIPYYIKKYINLYTQNNNIEMIKNETNNPTSLTDEIVDEWLNGGDE